MQVVLKIEANEIVAVNELSYYNHAVYRLKKTNPYGVTHLVEIYDDVCDYPDYELGTLEDGKLKITMGGEGDPVPTEDLGCGGVWISITLH